MNKIISARKVLIVDDEPMIRESLEGVFMDENWEVSLEECGFKALSFLKRTKVDLVLLDIWMEGLSGIETLQKIKEYNKLIPVVVMSGHGTIETAVKATKLGAMDYLEKPLSLEKIISIIEKISESSKQASVQVKLEVEAQKSTYNLIGVSKEIASLHRQIKVIAPRNSWVLITGENGTGKELIARNIHLSSPRSLYSFVAVNCAAIPEDLIESELFGYVKGAFSGASALRKGKFEAAHQGTIFLDEIGDMSLRTQAKILRLLQEQSFERLGDIKTISVDVRVVAATNKDLLHEIKEGRFREDLYYRLHVVPIHIPALRDRPEDIPNLCEYFLEKFAESVGQEKKVIHVQALTALKKYYWPGNIRELKNLLERLTIFVSTKEILVSDLPVNVHPLSTESLPLNNFITLKQAKSSFEKDFILEKLHENIWNISKTANEIGLERSSLHRKLKYYGIDIRSQREL